MRHWIRLNAARVIALAALAAPALACGDDPLGPQWPEDTDFAASLGIDLAAMTLLPSGVYIRIDQVGMNAPVESGEVTVDYTLWLPDGTEVDSGEWTFTLASGTVIPGFDEGVTGMRVGEIRTIVIPSELGYGAAGSTGVPPHSVLVFEVELLSGGAPI